MASEEKNPTEEGKLNEETQEQNQGTDGSAEVDDDRGELVIDEPEEKPDGDGESEEKEFEPTLDMMMNDFDDEQTMEEEEANEDQDNEEDELAALEQEQDMPIEELLKMYGAVPSGEGESEAGPAQEVKEADEELSKAADESKKEEPISNTPKDLVIEEPIIGSTDGGAGYDAVANIGEGSSKRKGSLSPQPTSMKKSKSELARFYEAAVEGRALRSQGQPEDMEEEMEDEEGEDSDSENRDYSWKKTIMIGPSYQASVPADLAIYGDTLPYENEDKLLWNPGELATGDVENYLSKSQEAVQSGGVGSLPLGAHVRDDEQALHLLLQCGYNCEEALRRRRMNAVPAVETMTLWSEEECRAFELGLRLYGKDFHMIQSQKVRTRSVGELVQFYYLWKKTERHDVFANNTRLEKKKYTLHPGTTDYMDRFIDEQDSSRDRSSSPNFYSLMFGNAEGRKGLSLYPGAKSQLNLGENNGAAASVLSNRESSSASSAPNPTSTVAAVSSEMATSAPQTTLNSGSNGSSENPSQPSLPPNPKSPQ